MEQHALDQPAVAIIIVSKSNFLLNAAHGSLMGEKATPGLARILVVDDEEGAREALEVVLEDDYQVVSVASGSSALAKIKQQPFDVVLLDITMPDLDGITTLKLIKECDESIDVIMISAIDSAREAASAMKCGAYDYITKPYEAGEILTTLQRVLKKRSLEQEVRYLRSEVAVLIEKSQIVSKSQAMQAIFRIIDKVAQTTSNVLITGESGTGKELVARAIHAKSQRAEKPFVALNCAAIPAELMESELFGHERGAFTGAVHRTSGKFEYAHGGTIFLDEVASLQLGLQAKILRVLQEREFTRVGSHLNIKVDVRVIAATNTRLDELVKEGRFRRDLYFRLNVIPIELPALRERREDIAVLANYFLARFSQQLNKKIKAITPAAMFILESYPWPGNIRELENLIERLVVLGSDGQSIDEQDLPFDLLLSDEADGEPLQGQAGDGLVQARHAFERQFILRVLERCRWNQTSTARLLGVHRNTLLQKMKTLHITTMRETEN
jgi:DNA-binding NtrC family response regulator